MPTATTNYITRPGGRFFFQILNLYFYLQRLLEKIIPFCLLGSFLTRFYFFLYNCLQHVRNKYYRQGLQNYPPSLPLFSRPIGFLVGRSGWKPAFSTSNTLSTIQDFFGTFREVFRKFTILYDKLLFFQPVNNTICQTSSDKFGGMTVVERNSFHVKL